MNQILAWKYRFSKYIEMKNLLLTIFLSLSFGVFSQNNYTISGTLMYDSFHQGGAYREFVPNPQPLANYKLLLIRYNEGDSIPEIVKTFTSDGEGNFSITVRRGKYGFAAVSDTLLPHQLVPQGSFSQDESWNTSSTSWVLNNSHIPAAIVIKDEEVSGITLVRNNFSACGLCP